ncbi:MAG: HD domain-containing protein [Bacilli bacterium]|nr:HD domain-containing protein [Bacilli bacterium]
MIEEFKKYVETFDINEPAILKKYTHSLRVKKRSEEIAQSENFNKENYELASAIGLLHDIGRFYQWHKYQTFEDRVSIDHGDYGAEELMGKNLIEKFYSKKENYPIIYEAVKYHNKYSIPDNVKSEKLCNLIRDADKIDIIYMYKIKELNISDEGEISKGVEENFLKEKLVNNKDINSKADICLRTLSLIYDLNYKYSYEYLKKENIIESLYNQISDKEKMKKYFKKTNEFIERRCQEC